jgi:predicted dehydrogenase
MLTGRTNLETSSKRSSFGYEALGTIGLVGLGRQGQRHLKTLAELGVQVHAVDNRLDQGLLNKFGTNNFLQLEQGDASRLFNDPTIPAVIIATPGNTHYDLVKQALTADKHVLVEKPFTRNADEAQELVDIAEQRTLLLMVGHNRFYLPHFQRLMKFVRSGSLGEILSVEANYLMPPQKNDRTHTALEGLGYHIFYMINALLDQKGPPELLSGVCSLDWETVGLKLLYGNVPATIKLDRNNSGSKNRNLIVKGHEFTASFDWSQEPDRTRLDIAPTKKTLYDEPEIFDRRELDILRSETILTGEEKEPSLYHELKVFLSALRTQATPPSNGRAAINVVGPIEKIRHQLADTGFYNSCLVVSGTVITSLARYIHERIGPRGGIVAIDGPSGIGKSTLSEQLSGFFELMYPSRHAMHFPMDEMRKSWPQCSPLKKHILGEALTEEDARVLEENGWTEVKSRQPYLFEESIWHNEAIEIGLRNIRRLFDGLGQGRQFTFTNYHAYLKDGNRRSVGTVRRTFRFGDVILLEGKYANSERFADLIDLHVRLQAPLSQVRERFFQERRDLLSPQQLASHMRYYDLAILPSWLNYKSRTRSLIDKIVDLRAGSGEN